MYLITIDHLVLKKRKQVWRNFPQVQQQTATFDCEAIAVSREAIRFKFRAVCLDLLIDCFTQNPGMKTRRINHCMLYKKSMYANPE